MANIVNSGQIVTSLFPPPPAETDPRSDLEAYLEIKEKSIIQYSQRQDHNQAYLDRQLTDYEQLQSICDKLTNLALYTIWCQLEMACYKYKDCGCDSINIIIPLSENSKGEKPVYFNFCEK